MEKDFHQYSLLHQVRQNPQAITTFVKSLWLEDFWDWRERLLCGQLEDPTEVAGITLAIRYMTWGGCRKIRPGMKFVDKSVRVLRNRLENLAPLSARLQGVEIINADCIDLLPQLDSRQAVYYLDPPYHRSARSAVRLYSHELTHDDHVRLLKTINKLRGKVVLSGYCNPLYRHLLLDWRKQTKIVKLNAYFGKKGEEHGYRTECLWLNFG